MELKEIYANLEKVDNGAEMIAAIKAEIAALSNEAKKHRQTGDTIAAKNKAILEALGCYTIPRKIRK